MHFQGENCTLSFGLHFDKEQVSLTGTLWPRRPPSREPRPHPLRLQFATLFSENELQTIQHWLASGHTSEPLPLKGNVRLINRVSGPDSNMVYLDLEFDFGQAPDWWDWPVHFPLTAQLEIRPSELTYLVKSMNRAQWSSDLTW
jgi:hypothetical protein